MCDSERAAKLAAPSRTTLTFPHSVETGRCTWARGLDFATDIKCQVTKHRFLLIYLFLLTILKTSVRAFLGPIWCFNWEQDPFWVTGLLRWLVFWVADQRLHFTRGRTKTDMALWKPEAKRERFHYSHGDALTKCLCNCCVSRNDCPSVITLLEGFHSFVCVMHARHILYYSFCNYATQWETFSSLCQSFYVRQRKKLWGWI